VSNPQPTSSEPRLNSPETCPECGGRMVVALTAVLAAGQVMGAHEAGALSQVTAVNPKCWERKMAFQVGDVVQLRYGGGPHMRIGKTAISNGNEVGDLRLGRQQRVSQLFRGRDAAKSGGERRAGEVLRRERLGVADIAAAEVMWTIAMRRRVDRWSSFLQFAARYAFESRYSQFDSHDPILSDIKFTQGQELPTALQLKFCPANLLTHYGGAILERYSKLHRIEV
jgi:hypothetical protein